MSEDPNLNLNFNLLSVREGGHGNGEYQRSSIINKLKEKERDNMFKMCITVPNNYKSEESNLLKTPKEDSNMEDDGLNPSNQISKRSKIEEEKKFINKSNFFPVASPSRSSLIKLNKSAIFVEAEEAPVVEIMDDEKDIRKHIEKLKI